MRVKLYISILKSQMLDTLVKLYQNFKCATILVSQITLRKQQRIADFF